MINLNLKWEALASYRVFGLAAEVNLKALVGDTKAQRVHGVEGTKKKALGGENLGLYFVRGIVFFIAHQGFLVLRKEVELRFLEWEGRITSAR